MANLKDWAKRFFNREPVVRSLSLENPTTPLSAPADWLFETLSGGMGLGGEIYVNEHTAMQLTTVRACVKAISEDVATVPLQLFSERDDNGNRRIARERNEYRLMYLRPNPHMTSSAFRQAMTANYLLWGNCYAEIQYNGAGKITAVWPRHPQFVKMEVLPNGNLRYIVNNPITNETYAVLSDDMIHIKDVSVDGYSGLNTIRHLRTAVGLGLALENFGLAYFLNGSRPGGVLETAGTLSPEAQDRLRKSWTAMHGGTGNTNKVAILEEGLKFTPIAINNDNAQYIESRNLQANEIARMFRIPPHKIGIMERSTFNNIEHQSLEYVTDCLRPHFVRWEEELNVKMFPSGGFEYEHDEDGLLRGDFATRMQGYAAGRQWGWLSANDVKRLESENTIGKQGDIYLSPLNMVPADKANQIEPTKPNSGTPAAPPKEPMPRSMERDEVKDCARGLFEDAVRRSLNYDNNAQLRKSMSQAFVKVLGLMARMLGRREDAESAARSYADSLYLRRSEWEGKEISGVVDKEFELACVALEAKELCQ